MQSAIEAANTVNVSKEEAWSELTRELQVRERIYDKWCNEGKLAWADARDRYARLKKAVSMLKLIVDDPHAS